MKLIESSVEYIPQGNDPYDICKHIELCARTCYKSENRITEDSANKMVNSLITAGHTSMLEHGTIYLKVSCFDPNNSDIVERYLNNHYSRVVCTGTTPPWDFAITTNLRVIVENHWEDDLQYLCAPTEFHCKRYSFKIICDRITSQSIIRHRVMSFAQESTRYCNYSKEKFGKEITFVKPYWYDQFNQKPDATGHRSDGTSDMYSTQEFEYFLQSCEDNYMLAIVAGMPPEGARALLPNCLKTEIIVTGFMDDWEHFLDLRLRGTTGRPQPDMLQLAKKLYDEFVKNDIIDSKTISNNIF